MKFKWLGVAYDVKFTHELVDGAEMVKGKKAHVHVLTPSCTATLMKWDKTLGWRECFSTSVHLFHKDLPSKILAEKYAFLKLFSLRTAPWREFVPGLTPTTEEEMDLGYGLENFFEFKMNAMAAFFTPKRRRMISAEGRRKKKNG